MNNIKCRLPFAFAAAVLAGCATDGGSASDAAGLEARCGALSQNPDDPALACAAVSCATGQDLYWSRCPSTGVDHEPLAEAAAGQGPSR